MLTLEKITTEYNEVEDRIRILALASDSSVITLWATQRMLMRLIPTISEWFDEKKNASSQMDEKSKELMNDFAQSEAQTELKAEQPVTLEKRQPQIANASANSWLINEIDLKYSDQLMELYFKNANQNVAKLILTKIFARQWLLILYTQWTKSEWPIDIWPSWFTQSPMQPEQDIH